MLTFEKKWDTKRIFEIKEIFSMKVRVTVEALRSSNLISQIKKNCYAYGHTQKYCRQEARCVKCVGKYYMKECPKPEQSHSKCGEARPANHSGCVVAKELQKFETAQLEERRKIRCVKIQKDRNAKRKQGGPMRKQ
jgi:hypothetical protein